MLSFLGTYAACGFQIQLVRKQMQFLIQVIHVYDHVTERERAVISTYVAGGCIFAFLLCSLSIA